MAEFPLTQSKSILNVLKRIDSWFWCKYSINPYKGCQYGCIYCNSRSDRYHLQADFHQTIYQKENAPELLASRLARARTLLPDVVVFSGVTDAYQSIETKSRLTRRLLEILAEYRYPVHIITKSFHVLKDLDVLEKIARRSWLGISVSLPHYDETVVKELDRRAPKLSRRLSLLSELNKLDWPNFYAQALAMPTILTADEEPARQIENFADVVLATGTKRILYSGISLSPGQHRFFESNLPDSIALDKELVQSIKMNPRHQHSSPYNAIVNRLWQQIVKANGIEDRIPRFIPDDFRQLNYKLAEKLGNAAYYRFNQGRDGRPLNNLAHRLEALKESISVGNLSLLLPEIDETQKDWLKSEIETLEPAG